ncbi:Type-1A pilin [Serratia quinivorans]|uniref:Fimbrial protein n=1 Tax=Serratia quinivorans TaxID=137545 RepID=A0ABV3UI54_9GAMM|nr:fimbrial protein [Serratia quinivorans]CAI1725153.1 Type-1A pilin [Serratia quinivorans]
MSLTAVMGGMVAASALAAPTSILNISGTVINASCDVDTESKNQSVDLGDVSPADFLSAGTTTAAKNFSVQLRICSATEVSTSFSGSAQDATDNSLLALSGGTPASGLAIQLLDGNGTGVDISSTETTTVSGTNPRLNYQLRYKSTADTVTTGDANGTLFMTFYYP